ncbi:MAG: UvrD-helicase domain-containing protein [Bacteroidaceae bacterium]|nr:UvrD-helicase domain-containing protein [Bacteroidaceae bacterium]
MNTDFIQQLNTAQREAVLYTDGPQLVIAGAGSGKTRVLTYKIAHLLSLGYEPWRILALTFTIKAANEMKERIAGLVGRATASRLWMGTFHSIFSRILHANAEVLGFRKDFTIYDTADSRSLLKTIIKEMQLDDKIYKPAAVQSVISNAKNALITPSAYAANAELRDMDSKQKRPNIHNIYRVYWERCFRAGAMDFDDLLLYTNILFRDHPDVAQRYRDFFRYVLVDEYQDTNFSQHLIVNQLCRDHRQLCVVGDDAQSIYSFRGANIGNILNLRNEYPDLRIDKLEQNYRSTQNIVDAANAVISKNKQQIPKRVFSEKERGSKVQLLSAYSDYEEAFLVANRIKEMRLLNAQPYNDFAILYRTNAQSRVLEDALRKRNMPYRIYGGLSFYQRKEIKDAVAYFRLTINPNDEEAFKRVINYPARGIGDTTVAKVLACAQTHNVGVWSVITQPSEYNLPVNAGARNKLSAFCDLIDSFRSLVIEKPLADTVEQILRRSGIINDIYATDTPENISRQENIQELINGVQEFVTQREEEGSDATTLADFLAEISLITDQDNGDESDNDKVTLMTIHSAKGLEFRNVIITGLEEDLFPSILSIDNPQQIEEERRLLYVAITRAQQNCILTYAKSRFRNGKTATCRPSRFIKDLDSRYVDMPDNIDSPFASASQQTMSWNTTFVSRKSATELRSEKHSYTVFKDPAETPHLKPVAGSKRLLNSDDTTAQQRDSIVSQAGTLRPNMRIRHDRFGLGTVESIEGSGDNCKISVLFDNVGRKQLLLKFAKFTIL